MTWGNAVNRRSVPFTVETTQWTRPQWTRPPGCDGVWNQRETCLGVLKPSDGPQPKSDGLQPGDGSLAMAN